MKVKHPKQFHKEVLEKDGQTIIIQGPVTKEQLQAYAFCEDLKAFRPPDQQYEALLSISELSESRIITAVTDKTIIGYVIFIHPDPIERWSEAQMDDLLVIGAIEVAHSFRNAGLSKKMLQVAFLDDALEDYIVMTTEYYWHWDLKGTGLSVWEYRKVMEKVMGSVGLQWTATDDPEICSHPANCLMVRFGKRVPQASIETFDAMRFRNRFMY